MHGPSCHVLHFEVRGLRCNDQLSKTQGVLACMDAVRQQVRHSRTPGIGVGVGRTTDLDVTSEIQLCLVELYQWSSHDQNVPHVLDSCGGWSRDVQLLCGLYVLSRGKRDEPPEHGPWREGTDTEDAMATRIRL